MGIDIERLKHDAEYWKSVCSDKCVCCYVVFAFGDPSNYRKVEFHDSWDDFVYAAQGNQVMCIPRPKKNSTTEWGDEGWPCVGSDCEINANHDCWIRAKCIALGHDHSGDVAIFQTTNRILTVSRKDLIRPYRTKEQRERDELIAFIDVESSKLKGTRHDKACKLFADAIAAKYELKERD